MQDDECATLLEAPVRLSHQSWPPGLTPLVSVCCITYNHRAYIAECIEGFLMQKTTFPVEILVHDDASTDGTAAVVADYQRRYPGLIKATLRTENQYSQGKSPGRYLRSIAKGKYIAYCEGDDSWIHPAKLQTQYEYLQAFPQAIIAAHDAEVIGNKSISQTSVPPTAGALEIIPGAEIISGRYLRMLSIFHRNHAAALRQCKPRRIVNGDRYLFAMLSVYGDTVLSNAKMAKYRIHEGGVWSGASEETRHVNMIKARLAIAWDIAPSHCPFACQDLYRLSTILVGSYSRRRRFSRSIQFLGATVLCLGISFRTLGAAPSHWPAMLAVQLGTLRSLIKVSGGIALRAVGFRMLRSK